MSAQEYERSSQLQRAKKKRWVPPGERNDVNSRSHPPTPRRTSPKESSTEEPTNDRKRGLPGWLLDILDEVRFGPKKNAKRSPTSKEKDQGSGQQKPNLEYENYDRGRHPSLEQGLSNRRQELETESNMIMETQDIPIATTSLSDLSLRSPPAGSDSPLGPLGLEVIYTPGDGHKADIVFVHGFGGGSRSTWSKNVDPEYLHSGMTPLRNVGNLRTLVIESAKGLLYDLRFAKDERKKDLGIGNVPLFFVVHSTGGFVVKESYMRGHIDPTYESIIKAISGIVFLATPHRGTNLGEVLARILRSTNVINSNRYVSELKKASLTLQKLNEQFRHIAPRLDIVSFYETQTCYVVATRIMVMAKDSSVLGLPGETSKALSADHNNVCKFDSPTDVNYIVVRNVLRSLVGKISRTEINQNPPLALQSASLTASSQDYHGQFFNGVHQVLGPSREDPFRVCSFLGLGSVGAVEEVTLTSGSHAPCVRKRVPLPPRVRREKLRVIQEEAIVLRSLAHAHIVEILGPYEDATQPNRPPTYCLLMSPVGDGDLKTFLDRCSTEDTASGFPGFSWLRKWFGCLASALNYMHAQGVRHQDIKPSNIVHRGGDIYFTDFSSSSRFEVGQTTSTDDPARASATYAAPEVADKFTSDGTLRKHGRKSDIFALGCVFCEMLCVLMQKSVPSFQEFLMTDGGKSNREQGTLLYSQKFQLIAAWFINAGDFEERGNLPDQFFELCISFMLVRDRNHRPDASEVLKGFRGYGVCTQECECLGGAADEKSLVD